MKPDELQSLVEDVRELRRQAATFPQVVIDRDMFWRLNQTELKPHRTFVLRHGSSIPSDEHWVYVARPTEAKPFIEKAMTLIAAQVTATLCT